MSSSAHSQSFPTAGLWASGRSEADSGAPLRAEDDVLMSRLKAGDEAALGSLLDRYGRLVLNIGYHVLRDPGEAQELVQEVFLHVYKKCQLFDSSKGSFRYWLIRIASHRAFDRREYLNLHRFYDDRNLDDFVEVIEAACDVHYQVEVSQNEARLRAAFSDLSDKQRATLELYFFDGYTLREISERLNESLANVRHHYYRALDRLRTSVRELNAGETKPRLPGDPDREGD